MPPLFFVSPLPALRRRVLLGRPRPHALCLPVRLALLAVLLAGLAPAPATAQTTVTSVRSGLWRDPATWSTGTVPTASSAVVVAVGHKVDAVEATVASLTLQSGAILQRESGPDGRWTLTVTGDVANAGTIQPFNMDADVGYDRLGLRVGGAITNAGRWDAELTELTGTGPQAISGSGLFRRLWTDTTPAPASPLVAGSDLRFEGRIDLATGTLALGPHRLRLQQSEAIALQNGRVTAAGGTLEALGAGNAVLADVRIEGAVTLAGYVNTGPNIVFAGPLTIAPGAVVQRANGPDAVWPIAVEGSVVNRGTVRPFNTDADVGYDRLAFTIGGDLTSSGRWEPESTTFTGTQAHTIRADSALRRVIAVAPVEGGTPGRLVAATDLTLRGVLRLGSATLDLGRFTLDAESGDPVAIEGGRIVSGGGTLRVTGSAMALQGVRIEGAVTLAGYVNTGPNIVFAGPLTIAPGAVVQRANGPDAVWPIAVEGSVVNRGTVRPFNTDADVGYDRLAFTIGGDFVNAGRWNPETTTFTGTRAHTLRTDSVAHSVFVVAAPTTGVPGELVAAAPLRFDGLLRLGPGTLRMDGHALTLGGGHGLLPGTPAVPTVEGGRIAFTQGALTFLNKGVMALQNVRIDGRVLLSGFVQTGPGIVFGGDLMLPAGSVLQRSSGADGVWGIVVEGTLTSRGEVRPFNLESDIGYDRLAFHLGRGLDADGAYAPTYTRFVGPLVHTLVHGPRRIDGGLELESPATPMGQVRLTRTFGGVVTRDFLIAEAAASGTGLDSVRLVGSGNAPPASFGNAVGRTWAFEPFPASARVAFTRLTLRYTDATLGTAREDSLQVYHSEDGGATWRRVSTATNLTRDAAANSVTLANAPAYGTYALSARALATPGRSNVVFVVTGPERLRVGPPNRYLLTYTNLGSAPTGEFLAGLTTTDGIYVTEVVPSAERPGDVPRPLRKENFSHRDDSTRAVFYVPNLAPGEERTLVATVRARADIQGRAFGGDVPVYTDPDAYARARARGSAGPALLWGGAVAAGGAASFVKDAWKETFIELVRNPEDARNAPDRALAKVGGEWAGGFEKGWGEVEGAMQGELVGLAGKGASTVADRANTAKEVADFLGALADANAEREERWRRADEAGPFGPGGSSGLGPFRVPIPKPDLPAAPAATPSPVRSWDPNEKVGPVGLGDEGFVTRFGRIPYVIRFENKKEATDAAYEIVIVDTLAATLDPETVVNGATSHPIFRFSRAGNVLRWRAEGIELPPNVNAPEGEGFVSFTVEARPGLPSGTRIANRATITFDLNAPIVTNTHVNTLDLSAPVTALTPLPAETATPTLTLRWAVRDSVGAGSGSTTTVFASRDGGPFLPVGVSDTGALNVPGEKGSTYRFYALSTDALGNAERDRPALVETRFLTGVAVDDTPGAAEFALGGVVPNPARGAARVRFTVPVSDAPVRLRVFDVLGREVAVLWNGALPAGAHEAVWEAGTVAQGVYFVRLEQGRAHHVAPLVVAR